MDHPLSSWHTATHKNTWKIYKTFGEPIFHGFTIENTGELNFDNLTLIKMQNQLIIEFSTSKLCGLPSFIMSHCNTQEHMNNLQVLWRSYFSWIHYGEYRRIVFWQSYTLIIEFSTSKWCGPHSIIMAHCNTQTHENLQVLWREYFSWINYGEYRRIVFWQSYIHPNSKISW